MKIECPICGVQGFLEVIGNYARVKHYKGFINGKGVYEHHKVPTDLISSLIPKPLLE